MAISDSKWRTKKIGTVVPFEKPELTEVVVKVQNPVPLNQPPKSFDTVSMGTPLVRRVTPQGEVLFHPLPNLQDYIASGGLCRIGASYYEGPHGYSIVLRDGKFHEFTNFKGRVSAKEIEISASGERVERYLIELTAEDGKIYQVRIPVEEWPSLLDVIERYAPLCQVYGDEIGNHRERFKRLSGFWLKKKFPIKNIIGFWGWGPQDANKFRVFFHGGREDCTSDKILPPVLPSSQAIPLIRAAFENIVSAGPFEVTVPLMLYALASYADAIFTDAGFPLSHCIMLIGESGYLKSSLAREIFSPFVPYEKRTYTVRSTEASMNVLHEKAFDDTLVIDDFNLEGSPAEVRTKMRNIRGLIRGYSDKTPRAKYGGADTIKQYAMRGGCVFTAETQMTGQLKSGELRYVKVCLHAPLDKAKIAILHDHPRIVPTFYAGFIRFLEEHYGEFVRLVRKQFPTRRSILKIPEPRMRDALIHLTLTADFLMRFLKSLSIYDENACFQWLFDAGNVLGRITNQQSMDAQIGEPYLRYLSELWNLLGTGKLRCAPNLQAYVAGMASFIGYRENDLFIVKKDEAYKAVLDAFYARNEGLPIGIDEVSKKLKDAGLTKCDAGSCLVKASAKIPGRPRMLAFIISACEKVVDGGIAK